MNRTATPTRWIGPGQTARCLLLALPLLLSACSPAQNTALAMHPPISPFTVLLLLDGVSVINTDKTIEDHVISMITGKDCSLVKASMGYDYCQPHAKPPTIQRISYCYKTIAAINCYEHPQENDASRLMGIRVDLLPPGP